jgi:hypothetical protein
VPRLNPIRTDSSLIPEPVPRRPYALSTLINSFGFGLGGRRWVRRADTPARPSGHIRLLDHIAVCVEGGALAESADFYTRAFGLPGTPASTCGSGSRAWTRPSSGARPAASRSPFSSRIPGSSPGSWPGPCPGLAVRASSTSPSSSMTSTRPCATAARRGSTSSPPQRVLRPAGQPAPCPAGADRRAAGNQRAGRPGRMGVLAPALHPLALSAQHGFLRAGPAPRRLRFRRGEHQGSLRGRSAGRHRR